MPIVFGLMAVAALVWVVQPAASDGSDATGRRPAWHWYVGGLGAFLLFFAWVTAPRDWRARLSPERETRWSRGEVLARRFRAVNDAREALLAEIAVQHALGRTRASERQRLVLVDSGVPAAAAVFVDSLVRGEVRRLELGDTLLRVFITRPASDSSRASALRARRPIDISWLLPDSTRPSCLTVVRLNRDEVANLLVATGTSLLGPCAFVARFGRPGPQVDRWLRGMDYSVAAFPAWANTGLGSNRADERPYPRSSLTARQSQCVMADAASCRALLAIDSASLSADEVEYGTVTFRDFSMGGPRLARFERLFLSDLVRDLGPERFGAFWRSPDPVSVAYLSAAGRPIEADASAWMRRFYEYAPGGPAVPAPTLGAFAAAVVIAGLTTARRRTGQGPPT
ncbi:MAG: hypothetical protein JNJ98_20120 [Gemmatimonadetes bacterium]|nr:hypothetical protein [Gemmatimonadota bacterium]